MHIKNQYKTLVILDVDETLLHATAKELSRKADFMVFDYYVYLRPFLTQFLKEINKHFLVAIWSSASDDYVQEIAKTIIPDEMQLEFVWGRSRCTPKNQSLTNTYNYTAHDFSHYNYIKPLKKLKKKGYILERILIVDDTPFKCKDNYGNAIYPKEYLGELEDNELKKLTEYLNTLKDEKNVRNIEKRGWENQF